MASDKTPAIPAIPAIPPATPIGPGSPGAPGHGAPAGPGAGSDPAPAVGSFMVGPHAPRIEIIHGAFIVEVRQGARGIQFDLDNPWPLPMIPRIKEALLIDDGTNKIHGTVLDVRYNMKTLATGLPCRIIIHINDSLQ